MTTPAERGGADGTGAGETVADVVVIGVGVGGEAVAGTLADAGLDVVAVEDRLVGGECPYWGCIPSKAMVHAAGLIAAGRRIPGAAGEASVTPDWAPVARRVRELTADWDDTSAADRLIDKRVRLVRGSGRLTGAATVAVTRAEDGEEELFRARHAIVVAAGTSPFVPPVRGLADTPFWTNREAVEAGEAPGSLAVLGGGAIGLELAQAFARFGTRVTVLEGGGRVLAAEEPESSALVAAVFAAEGIEVRTHARAERVEHDGTGFTVTLTDGDTVAAERLLVATGRRADLATLGADTIGVHAHADALPVDPHMRVTPGGRTPPVWAVGDITGKGAFTHVATYQAEIAAKAILHSAGLGPKAPEADYTALPRVTFTDPEIGAVGLTERRAVEAGVDTRVALTDLAASSRGHIVGARGFLKVVADARKGVLVGATAAGPAGGEVLGALAVAVHGRVPVTALRGMILAYPTLHRAIGSALAELGM